MKCTRVDSEQLRAKETGPVERPNGNMGSKTVQVAFQKEGVSKCLNDCEQWTGMAKALCVGRCRREMSGEIPESPYAVIKRVLGF